MKTNAANTNIKKKKHKTVVAGRAVINATFNNTIVTISDSLGNVLCWASAGSSGFKGSRKSAPYAAQMAAENVGKRAQELFGVKTLDVKIIGAGSGRDSALRALNAVGFSIASLADDTGVPHNGCKPEKRPRT
jgi:small subunit ribosomal protein S11